MALRKKYFLMGILGVLLLVSGVGCTDSSDLSIEKKASPETFTHVGETIIYTYIVTNHGETTIKKISIIDDMVELSYPEFKLFQVPRSAQRTGTYQITEEDMEAGFVTNKATARGFQEYEGCGDGTDVGGWISASAEFTVTFREAPALQLTKIGTPNWFNHRSQQITYSYTIENTGNIPLA